ncbi:MAG: TIGR04086 family membrane protein [Clostridia bacterium]|nr:TIGR04086 family membrane protein [Clostridia bacterium]
METKKHSVNDIIKGVGISVLASIFLILIFSAILTYTNTSEQAINPVIIVIMAISILIGSSIGNTRKGLINGGVIGLAYMIIIYLISSILNNDFGFNLYHLIFVISGVLFGIVGGIIGANKK